MIPASNIRRNSIQRTMKTARGRGGDFDPNPGRAPAGANAMATSASSSITRSGWVSENARHVVTKDRKIDQQTKSAIRGQRLRTSITAAARPHHPSTVIMPLLPLIQNRLGARRNATRAFGWASRNWASNPLTGVRPCGPINAPPSAMMPAKMMR